MSVYMYVHLSVQWMLVQPSSPLRWSNGWQAGFGAEADSATNPLPSYLAIGSGSTPFIFIVYCTLYSPTHRHIDFLSG